VREVRIIESKKRCAIVNFFERGHAENALQQVNGTSQQKGGIYISKLIVSYIAYMFWDVYIYV
jgi:hypothetical protein